METVFIGIMELKAKVNIDKYNAELQWIDPGTKVTSEFSTKRRILPSNAQTEFSLFPSF